MRYLDARIGHDPLTRLPRAADLDPEACVLLEDPASIPDVLPFPGTRPAATTTAALDLASDTSPTDSGGQDHRVPRQPHTSDRPVVLHVVNATPSGALEESLVHQAVAVDRERFHPMLAIVHPPDWEPQARVQAMAQAQNLPLLSIPSNHSLDGRPARTLRDLCHLMAVRLWVGHDTRSDLLGTWIHRTHPLERLATLHGPARPTRRERLKHRLRLRLLPWTTGQVMTTSAALQTQAEQSQRLDPARLHHLPPALDPQHYPRQRSRADARRHLHVARDRRAIGLAGVLDDTAGVEDALKMMAAFAPYRDHIDLHVLGDGPGAGRLKTLALRLGLTERVHWWGRIEDAREHYELFDLLLLPSVSERLSHPTLEAMALGVPIAARSTSVTRELLEKGRCGLLLEEESPEAWAPQVIALLADRDRRQTFIRRSQRHLQRHHVLDAQMRRTTRLFDSLLGRRNQPAPALRQAA